MLWNHSSLASFFSTFTKLLKVKSHLFVWLPRRLWFLQRVSIAMQSAVLAIVNPSVRPSVCPSATRWQCAKTTQATIMRSSRQDSLMTLVSSWLTSLQNSKGNIGREGAEWERGRKNRQFLANKSPYLRNGARWNHSYNDRLIGRRISAFDWYQNHRPWMTLNDLERPKRTLVQKRCVFGAHCTNLNDDRSTHPATKM